MSAINNSTFQDRKELEQLSYHSSLGYVLQQRNGAWELDERCEELLIELLKEKRKLDEEHEEAHDLRIVIEDLAKENRAPNIAILTTLNALTNVMHVVIAMGNL